MRKEKLVHVEHVLTTGSSKENGKMVRKNVGWTNNVVNNRTNGRCLKVIRDRDA